VAHSTFNAVVGFSMAQTSLVKVTSAFVAGIVVALGSALIYVKVSEAPPASRAVWQIPDSGQAPEKMDPEPAPPPDRVKPPAAKPADKPVQQAVAKPQPAVPVKVPKHLTTHIVKKPSVQIASAVHLQSKTVQVVRQTPAPVAAPPPVYQPTPAPKPVLPPAVNDAATLDGPRIDAPRPVAAPAPPVEPHVVTLQPGTMLAIRLGETLSTEHNYTGDTFRGTLDVPIVIDGFIIADKGSKVLGRIVNAQQAGRMQGRSNLSLALTEINTTDGQRVIVETSAFDQQGASNAAQSAAKMAGGAALGAIIGAIGGSGKGAAIGAGVGGAAGTGAVLLSHGKPMVLTAETQVSFQLSKPAVITEKLN
jgi:hypothetical protein